MFQEALRHAASYFDVALLPWPNKHCCCSSDPRDDAQYKHGDVVVFSDWDTKEDQQIGPSDSRGYPEPLVAEPQAVRGTRGVADRHGAPVDGKPVSSARLSSRASDASSRQVRDGSDAASEEALALREMMKKFVQDMIRGRPYLVVVENGRTEPCKLLLTPNLQYIQLEAAGVTHDIPLRNIKDICPGKLLENRFTPVVLDELCSTLVLRNNECVTFRLQTLKERDEFTKCIKVLSLALE